jgi:prepilin-type N-terminal cleavage/methylation domain-containing protein
MQKAFTMIELIFTIVIIGILAAVAIPKLSATRDDAVIASEINSLKQSIDNLRGVYLAKGTSYGDGLLGDKYLEMNTKCFRVVLWTSNSSGTGEVSVSYFTKDDQDADGIDTTCTYSQSTIDGIYDKAVDVGLLAASSTSHGEKLSGTSVVY